ncbi:Histidine kinase-, DNA gyrase B-, and HSP90-like ATPase [Geoalkalibacter ferrihydriticus]|uniref:histidine kinase n=2 Tax=Geoalkalibacter ferrihydriticus TaxID=392333 RepID=A0A0C2HT03_9BACT|nr:response regulator [Geoalkalibacter ferrihydriticus]KIH75917.1 hypothetical protein GFER_13450 [Geoalkalibacter ferrihydriticus DSM 17813]SDM55272.1 Histidine kinase-, DNA gyrase B-, and HSP90-like ATPase [Geoalkalibacter ferrihydriticus]
MPAIEKIADGNSCEETTDFARGRVLVVDDEPELAELLAYSLHQQGFATITAADGFNACRMIESERPDLIVLDIMMPDLDGWEVCRLLRSVPDEDVATIPVIMLTALSDLEDRLRGLELGADAYVSKPYSPREVLALVDNLVTRRRREQSQRRELTRVRSRERLSADIQSLLFHELRNQLVVIGGFSGLLSRGGYEKVPAKAHTYLKAIQRSSDYLSLIAEEFHMIGQIENEGISLPMEEVDLHEIVQEVVALFGPLAECRGVNLKLCEDSQVNYVPVQGNRAALKVIISNLVDNAIKFSAIGKEVCLRLLPTQNRLAGVEVSDHGPGISRQEQELVFRKFCRGRTGSEQVKGSGLGLYVVRTLVQAMDGGILLDSEPGRGCCFQVRFAARDA